MDESKDIKYCTFCGKNKEDVRKIIVQKDGIGICNECVEICVEILNDDDEWKVFKSKVKKAMAELFAEAIK